MSTRHERWPAGHPCWTDLATPDPEAAAAFYRDVAGWDVGDPDDGKGGYRIASVGGHAAAGLGPLQAPGQPSAWLLHFATEDATASAAAVERLGGTVVAPPMDVDDLGRFAVATDPTGAAFGLWQAGSFAGAEVVNEPGGIVWEDLRSRDPDAARAFYAELFGWRYAPVEGAPADYATFATDERPLGGVGGFMGGPADQPSHWLVYVGVRDADAAVAAAGKHGGAVHVGPVDTPYGRLAVVGDRAGAALALMTLAEGAVPQ